MKKVNRIVCFNFYLQSKVNFKTIAPTFSECEGVGPITFAAYIAACNAAAAVMK
jgi:hypothetical protein